jgi:hypothetical protein
MENLAGPRLLQAFFEYATDEALSNLDNLSKAALRLSCKNAKAFVDGTVTTAAGQAPTLETILRCDWQLSELFIRVSRGNARGISQNDFTSLLYALCSNFLRCKCWRSGPSFSTCLPTLGSYQILVS